MTDHHLTVEQVKYLGLRKGLSSETEFEDARPSLSSQRVFLIVEIELLIVAEIIRIDSDFLADKRSYWIPILRSKFDEVWLIGLNL